MLTGNRGIIHDPRTRLPTARRWTTKAWIACSLHWKGVRRDVWGMNRDGRPGWSELFFLDEVTALAAGHRPCFACRRADALRFAGSFGMGNGMRPCSAPAMDRILHVQRRASSSIQPVSLNHRDLASLPEGTVIQAGKEFLALRRGWALPWDFSGYGSAREPGSLDEAALTLVTPPAIVNALEAGYVPAWHESAGA